MKYLSEAVAAGEHIKKIIERVPKIDSENSNGKTLDSVQGEVEFRGVEFAYPSRVENPILLNFHLRVPPGKTVALVGGSGSGKSTIISLLQRFYDPLKGEVLLDGVNIRRLQLKWLRSQMGLVSQEPALFATSIKENILFGKEDGNMEEVVDAAKAANAHSFISQLPLGYDTQVNPSYLSLSLSLSLDLFISLSVYLSIYIYMYIRVSSLYLSHTIISLCLSPPSFSYIFSCLPLPQNSKARSHLIPRRLTYCKVGPTLRTN